ncbi:Mg-protoporphyrin IX methyl transferase [Thalassoglobus neptunius]|uniref:Mg-protoporphyrin IX methyl transferase n=2 Tax=Thalassoglobus neptunius TaxID=1938619 RepID=A0A5C5X6G0_9PLAN|nr:Mg-protoporphyrin IX methyl transferase [Thalassoglobus neptunius]
MGISNIVHRIWRKAFMSRTAFTKAYGRIRMLYSIEDPWQMSSPKEQHRFQETVRILSEVQPKYSSILELGCGEGHQSQFLGTLTDQLYGVDISPKAVERAAARCPEGKFQAGELEAVATMFNGQKFDLITACEVLYYTKDLAEILPTLQAMTHRLFVSNYKPRNEHMRAHFEGNGWRALDSISYEDVDWECRLWESEEVTIES